MSYQDTIEAFASTAEAKADMARNHPLAFAILAAKAGAFIGFGILLIFSVGQAASPELRPLIMGASFGIALILVVFAGAELFTGHTMYMTIGRLENRTDMAALARTWSMSWAGNLLGAFLLSALFVLGGGGLILSNEATSVLMAVAEKKAHSPAFELICRAILCNWLVCLAIWCSQRTQNDMAKCTIIFWCLLAFIAAGFEHSVANMTVFSVSILADAPGSITVMDAARNLVFVTFGNIIAGAVIMGMGYWTVAAQVRGGQRNHTLAETAEIKEK